MSKEKTIPDPPAHIKEWIRQEWDEIDGNCNYEISGSQGFKLGATAIYQKDQQELEERSVGFAEWANKEWNIGGGGTYWYKSGEWDSDGQLIKRSSQQLYSIYLESLNH